MDFACMASSVNHRWRLVGRTLGGVFLAGASWLVLVQADTRSPGLAIATILAAGAAGAAMGTGRGWSIRPTGALRFVPFFIWVSLHGAFDVVARAFAWRRPLAPQLVEFRPRLDSSTPSGVFFLEIVSLLPGTLCADIVGDQITVHVIDRSRPNLKMLRRLEERVAAVFGVELPADDGGSR
jgi:multicomponent Na+:H+ antiporter subunit E